MNHVQPLKACYASDVSTLRQYSVRKRCGIMPNFVLLWDEKERI